MMEMMGDDGELNFREEDSPAPTPPLEIIELIEIIENH